MDLKLRCCCSIQQQKIHDFLPLLISGLCVCAGLFSFVHSEVFQTFVISLFMQFEVMWIIVVVRGFTFSDGNYPFSSFIPKPVKQY